jgi:3-oxoacyl-[acyl-carrier protein] reductase
MTAATAQLPNVGDSAELTVELSSDLVDRFTDYCGDTNPLHHSDELAQSLGFSGRVVHGMSYAAFLSTLIGTKLPGSGSLWASQSYRFVAPAFIGDTVTLRVQVEQSLPASRSVTLRVEAVNQHGHRLMEGESVVLLPSGDAESSPKPADRPTSVDRPVALVAGAGGALGAAIANALAETGYALALGGRTLERLSGPCAELRSKGAAAQPILLDLTNAGSVESAVEQIGTEMGPIGLAVHCASAPLPDGPAADTDWQSFRNHFEVQAGGLHRLLHACAPDMRAAKSGQFIFVASSAVHGVPPKGLSAYTSAKAAGCALARSMAVELAPFGIRTNIISPHFVATPLTHRTTEKSRKLIAATTPLRRLATARDVAQSVAFLASDAASFINGHDLAVDGGAVMA